MKKLSIITFPVLLLIVFTFHACVVDEFNDIKFRSFETEKFSDLSLSTVESLETPFQSYFTFPGSRTKGDIDLVDISKKLDELFPDANVLDVEEETERGLSVWEIKIKMPGGGILKLYFVKELNKIIKIKGTSGPYDYEIDPGGSFIPFSEAKQLAFQTIGGGEIEKWSLEIEENNEWEYEIHIFHEGDRFEVEIEGFENEVIAVKEKHETDDLENDDEHEATPPDVVAEFALSLFQGEIIHSETKQEDDFIRWKIYIESASGAIVKFKIVENPLQLIEMEGKRGPFDYDINPGDPFISLQAAIEIALSEIGGELTEWEFEAKHDENEDHEGNLNRLWFYKIKIIAGDQVLKVIIDAETGAVLNLEGEEHHQDTAPAAVAELALSLFQGEIIHSEKRQDGDRQIWKIYIQSESGAIVQFKILEDPLELIEMEGEIGPFDYDIDPGEAFISLREARAIALTLINGELLAWEFEPEHSNGHVFMVYELRYIMGDEKFEILIHAETGEILNDVDHGDVNVPDAVADFARSVFDGEIIHSELFFEENHRIWHLSLASVSGAMVELTILEDPLKLVGATGFTEPFDYNIEPGEPYITLNAAIEAARNKTDGELIIWTFLPFPQVGQISFIYALIFTAGIEHIEIIVNAETGEIIETDRSDSGHADPPDEVKEFSFLLFPGTIIHSARHHGFGQTIWEIFIESESTSILKLWILEDPLSVVEMIGEKGPFDYNVEPGDPYISLSAAREIAGAEVDGVLVRWAFHTFFNVNQLFHVYRLVFETSENRVELVIHAETGEILAFDGNGNHIPPPDIIRQYVASVFPGDIIFVEKHHDGDKHIWEIEVVSDAGVIVSFKLFEDPLEIIEIRGNYGPFEYNIEPGDPYITLEIAREVAGNEIDGELLAWSFIQEEANGQVIRVYVLIILSGDKEIVVTIHAESGEILDIKD